MSHEWSSKECSGVSHFEDVEWQGFATDDLTDVPLLQNFAFGYTPTRTVCTNGGWMAEEAKNSGLN